MLTITYYMIANPLIALGLAILIVLFLYNTLRRQARIALGLWLLMVVVFVYIYVQSSDQARRWAEEASAVPASTESGRN